MMDESDESGESYEPILPEEKPAKAAPPPPPLKRLWKTPTEADEVEDLEPKKSRNSKKSDEPAPSPRPKKPKLIARKKPAAPVIDDGTGAIKLEETPVLDTFAARQRARWLIGGLIGVIGVIFVSIVFRTFGGGENEEIRDGEPPDPRTVSDARPNVNVEDEAQVLLENARQADKQGKTKASVNLLGKLVKAYPNTASAREAQAALDRDRQKKPLFGDDSMQASGPSKPPQTAGQPTPNTAPTPATPEPPKTTDVAPTKPLAPVVPVATPVVINPLPRGYRPNFDAPIHPSGWPTRIKADKDGAEMVLVLGGTFLMGREDGDAAERPVHQVTLSTYYIDQHEVTVRQYTTYLKETGRPLDVIRRVSQGTGDAAPSEDSPIVNISARDAKAFCLWAGRRLPTEAQWEMAARSTDGRISFWNGELPRKDPAKGPRVMEPVMSLPSDLSACGAYDMGANAWEWTSEYYDSQHYQQFHNLVVDPVGPKESRTKIALVTVRGGSKSGVLTWRDGLKIETKLPYLGFRGALSVEGLPAAPATATPSPTNGAPPSMPGGIQPF